MALYSFWFLSQLLLWSSSYCTFFVNGYNYTLLWKDGEKQLYRVQDSDVFVNTYISNSETAAEVAPFDEGYLVVWPNIVSSGSSSGTIQMQLMDTNAEKKSGEVQVTNMTSEPVWADVATSTLTGNAFVVWAGLQPVIETYTYIYGQIVSPAGEKVGAAVTLNSYDKNYLLPKIAAFPTGNFLVVWQSYDIYTSIYSHEFYSDGTPVYTTEAFIQSFDGQPTVNAAILGNSSYVIVWDQDGDIIAQICWTGGYKISSEIKVSPSSNVAASSAEVAGLSNGGFVVTWAYVYTSVSSTVYVQIMDSEGEKVGDAFEVTQYMSAQKWSKVATLLSGFVVIWSDDTKDGNGNGYAICGQVFSNNGTRIGAEFSVNTIKSDDQTFPSVTGFFTGELAGGFAVTWRTYRSGADEYDVYTQLFLLEEPPSVVQTIEAQLAYADQEFTFTVPKNTFYDLNQDFWIVASGVPNWLTYSEATWEFNGVPSASDVGTVYINLTAIDEFGGDASTFFSITVEKIATTSTTKETEPANGVKGISVGLVAGLVLLSLSFVTDGIF